MKSKTLSPPVTRQGKLSLIFLITMPILFSFGFSLARGFYSSVQSGETIIADIFKRPLLALSMITGHICGVGAFITGIQAITKKKERSIFVFISAMTGGLVLVFLAGEILFPH